jgi:hypothetical protein
MQEKFVASGLYHRYEGQNQTKATEAWSRHELAEGATLTRVDVDWRGVNGVSRLAEVLQNHAGKVERLTLQIHQTAPSAPYRVMRLDYIIADGYVQMTRALDRQAREYAELETPPPLIVRLTDFALFWGEVVKLDPQLAQGAQVFVPILKPTGAMGAVVKGAMPIVEGVEQEEVSLPRGTQTLTRYVTKGQRLVWLNAHGYPVKVSQWQTNTHDILANFAHR